MHPEKFQVDKVQNGRLSAIIPLDKPDSGITWKPLKISTPLSIKQIVRLQERMHFEKIQLVQVQNGRQSAIIHFHMAVIW